MVITHELTMDLNRRGVTPVVDAVQGDVYTREVKFTLTDNGVPFFLPEGVNACVAFQKPDGKKGLYDHLPDGNPATSISGNTVTAVIAPQALTCDGIVLAAVVFYGADGDTLATFTFFINVEKNPAIGEEVSNDYYNPSIIDLIARIEEIEQEGGVSGVTFTPSVSDEGIISWTNDGGLANPASVNIKGPRGVPGATFTPSVSADGTLRWENNGGLDNPAVVNIKGPKGDTGADGADGAAGKTPVKGTDYYTAADKAEMVDAVLAALPTWTGGSY